MIQLVPELPLDNDDVKALIAKAVAAAVAEVTAQLEQRIDAAIAARLDQAVDAALEQRRKAKNRGILTKEVREAVLARDGLDCRYCGQRTTKATLVFDHYVPVSLGGKTTLGNLVVTCVLCNRRKGETHPDLLASIGMALRLAPGEVDPRHGRRLRPVDTRKSMRREGRLS